LATRSVAAKTVSAQPVDGPRTLVPQSGQPAARTTSPEQEVPMPPKAAAPSRIYRLKITLKGIKPPIWRRIEVADSITLRRLHLIIQAVMGWEGAHVHMFIAGTQWYGDRDIEYGMFDVRDERRTKLNQVLSAPKQKLSYDYDFGADWVHEVLLEKITAPEPDVAYPRCTDGARHCPPEDCGGIWGYEEFLAALADPQHPNHEDVIEWHDFTFDPERFDLDGINTYLKLTR
jgi:hypothetical protein